MRASLRSRDVCIYACICQHDRAKLTACMWGKKLIVAAGTHSHDICMCMHVNSQLTHMCRHVNGALHVLAHACIRVCRYTDDLNRQTNMDKPKARIHTYIHTYRTYLKRKGRSKMNVGKSRPAKVLSLIRVILFVHVYMYVYVCVCVCIYIYFNIYYTHEMEFVEFSGCLTHLATI